MRFAGRTARLQACLLAFVCAASAAQATTAMQKQARTAGVKIDSCLDCHASPHSKQVMEKKAHEVGFLLQNCQNCHGSRFPVSLNDKGRWLVSERQRRSAKTIDGAWLKEYVEPKPGAAPK